MIVEAVNTAKLALVVAVAWAGAIGGALAFVACVAAYCVGMLVAPGARAVRKRVKRPLWARTRLGALRYARTRVRRPDGRTAPWVHTQPRRYEEAA